MRNRVDRVVRRVAKLCARLCAVLLWLSAGSAPAALLVSETFNYPVGALGGNNGGTGFTTAWTAHSAFNIENSNLGSGRFTSAGRAARFSSNSFAASYLGRTMNTSFGANGTDVWASFLTRIDSLNAYTGLDLTTNGALFGSLHIGVTGGTSGLGPPSSTWALDIGGGTTPVYSNVPVVFGQTTALVVHIQFLAGVDQVQLFVNPSPYSQPITPNAIKSDSNIQFNSVLLSANAGSVLFDEFRVGNTYADVAFLPEPNSVVLLLPVLVLLAWGWRQRSVASRRAGSG